jgi:hypothetical protein
MMFARQNVWRTRPDYDLDDLYQEGYLVYLRIKERYPDAVDPPHFMKLFMVSYENVIHDISSATTNARHVAINNQQLHHSGFLADADVRLFLEEAPPLARKAMKRALEGKKPAKRRNYFRLPTNDYLCALAGVNPRNVNMRKILFSWLGQPV